MLVLVDSVRELKGGIGAGPGHAGAVSFLVVGQKGTDAGNPLSGRCPSMELKRKLPWGLPVGFRSIRGHAF